MFSLPREAHQSAGSICGEDYTQHNDAKLLKASALIEFDEEYEISKDEFELDDGSGKTSKTIGWPVRTNKDRGRFISAVLVSNNRKALIGFHYKIVLG